MKKLILFLMLLACSAQSQIVYLTLTVTNSGGTTNGNTVTINSDTRTFTNNTIASPATLIASTNNPAKAATNIYTHFALHSLAGVKSVRMTATNKVELAGTNGMNIAFSISGTWGTGTLQTSVVTSVEALGLDAAAYSLAQRTNFMDNIYAIFNSILGTNSLLESAPGMTNYVALSRTETMGNKTLTNSTVKGGLLSSNTVDSPVTTNLVNYGKALRSEGAGANSFQAGSNAVSAGLRSVAVGVNSLATNDDTVAVGQSAQATTNLAMAVGNSASATVYRTMAIGFTATANASAATAVGPFAQATGATALSVGASAGALALNGTAVGASAEATENSTNGIAVGAVAYASANDAIAIGSGTLATHTNAIALGAGAATTAANQVRLGGAKHTTIMATGIISGSLVATGSVSMTNANIAAAGLTATNPVLLGTVIEAPTQNRSNAYFYRNGQTPNVALARDTAQNTNQIQAHDASGVHWAITSNNVMYAEGITNNGGFTNVGSILQTGSGNAQFTSITNSTLTGTNTLTGDISFTHVNNTALVNGYNSGILLGTNVFVRISGPSGAYTNVGFVAERDGSFHILRFNNPASSIAILNNSGLEGTAANRIVFSTNVGGILLLTNNPAYLQVIYDGAASAWNVMLPPNILN